MGEFFINTANGHVATRAQLVAAAVASPAEPPPKPWHAIQGPRDASTLWYAVLRKRTRGVVIGTLCIRHGPQHASLLREGWEEVAIEEIRYSATLCRASERSIAASTSSRACALRS